jgi:hypothetical protein
MAVNPFGRTSGALDLEGIDRADRATIFANEAISSLNSARP